MMMLAVRRRYTHSPLGRVGRLLRSAVHRCGLLFQLEAHGSCFTLYFGQRTLVLCTEGGVGFRRLTPPERH